MEVRKIQNSASGSFFVTLPKSWVKEMDINKGEELMMSQDEDGTLKINPIKNQKNYYYQFVIQTEDYPEETSLVRCINSSYIQGADVISILCKNTITLNKKVYPLLFLYLLHLLQDPHQNIEKILLHLNALNLPGYIFSLLNYIEEISGDQLIF